MNTKLSEIDERILKNKAAIKKLQEERKAEAAKIKSRTAADARKAQNRIKIIVGSLLCKHNPEIAIKLLESHGSDKDKELIKHIQNVINAPESIDKESQDLIKSALG